MKTESFNDVNLVPFNRKLIKEFEEGFEERAGYFSSQIDRSTGIRILRELSNKFNKSFNEITQEDLENFFSQIDKKNLDNYRQLVWSFYRWLYHWYKEEAPPVNVEETYMFLAGFVHDDLKNLHF